MRCAVAIAPAPRRFSGAVAVDIYFLHGGRALAEDRDRTVRAGNNGNVPEWPAGHDTGSQWFRPFLA
ncbi:hypothetical protein GCM10027091_13010 [Streptomyces daliensis]